MNLRNLLIKIEDAKRRSCSFQGSELDIIKNKTFCHRIPEDILTQIPINCLLNKRQRFESF